MYMTKQETRDNLGKGKKEREKRERNRKNGRI